MKKSVFRESLLRKFASDREGKFRRFVEKLLDFRIPRQIFFKFRCSANPDDPHDKAPLIWLSNILYWQQLRPVIFDIVRKNITLVDEYGLENTHSILRAQTKPYYSVQQLVQKAKSIFASKSEQHNFRSAFTPPQYYSFTGKQLNSLTLSGAVSHF